VTSITLDYAKSIISRTTSMFESSVAQKAERFEALATEAAHCVRCPSMCEKTAVLSELNGPLSARIMFIGEAPGRKGADRTRIPFSGDQSGKNFDRFLAAINLRRDQIFITSAALCNPQTSSGANRKPTQTEVTNCSEFLRRAIDLVDPLVIVTLGSVALDALKRIHYHEFTLKEAVGKLHEWNGRSLVPIYHPSPQVLASHRREAEQLADYKVVAHATREVFAAAASS
jgi:uracil-DNA glycosylase